MAKTTSQEIKAKIIPILTDAGLDVDTFDFEKNLSDQGVDSAVMALLFAELEDLTGIDPFSSQGNSSFKFPKTMNEMITMFQGE